MKKFLLIFTATLLSGALISQNQPDTIKAEVDGNSVILSDIGAFRNCGAIYEMKVDLEDNKISWLQKDVGMAAFCMCNFDMWVEITGLEPGSYTADVFFTELYNDDTTWAGSVSFDISSPLRNEMIEIVDFSQSDCYNTVNVEEYPIQHLSVNCYPNPATSGIVIEFGARADLEISILDLLGQKIRTFSSVDAESKNVHWDLHDKKGNRVSKGIYFYVITSGKEKVCGKLMIE